VGGGAARLTAALRCRRIGISAFGQEHLVTADPEDSAVRSGERGGRGGRRALLADVTDAASVAAILAHLGLAIEPPLVARARDPSADAA